MYYDGSSHCQSDQEPSSTSDKRYKCSYCPYGKTPPFVSMNLWSKQCNIHSFGKLPHSPYRWKLEIPILNSTYSDVQKSCTFFLEFFHGSPGLGEMDQFRDWSILWPVPKLAPLPQGAHKKNWEKMCKTFARYCRITILMAMNLWQCLSFSFSQKNISLTTHLAFKVI